MIIAVGCAAGRIAGKLGLPFAAVNTDQEELDRCQASTKLQIGLKWMRGFPACVPELGAQSAMESRVEIGKLCRERVPCSRAFPLGAIFFSGWGGRAVGRIVQW
jgi:cell division GTPase FtsZ